MQGGASDRIQKQEKRWEWAARLELFLLPLGPMVAGLYAAGALDMGLLDMLPSDVSAGLNDLGTYSGEACLQATTYHTTQTLQTFNAGKGNTERCIHFANVHADKAGIDRLFMYLFFHRSNNSYLHR